MFALGAVAVAAIVVVAVKMSGHDEDHVDVSSSTETNAAAADGQRGAGKCNLAGLVCGQFSTQGRIGTKLHELVYAARTGGRYAEAICLAQRNVTAADGWLAGASHFEASNAWEALGCHDLAIEEVEASLQVRPHGRSGWKETCDWCAKLHGTCSPCSSNERIECPASAQLVKLIAPTMLSQAPSGTVWNDPSVDLCTVVALPRAGWYVVGSVHQDTPDRTFRFHIAIDAGTRTVVASSEGEQHSIHEACEMKLVSVDDHPGAPSTVRTRQDCVDKMMRAFGDTYTATIAPPKILVR